MKRWHVVLPLLLLPAAYVSAQAPTIERCDELVLSAPDDPGSYWCYVQAAHGSGRFDDAMTRVKAILAVNPDRHRARLSLAILQGDTGMDQAETTYLAALDGFENTKDAWGVVYARTGLASFLQARQRFDESEPHVERSLEIARDSGDPFMEAHAQVRAASLADGRSDYGRTLDLYLQAEARVFPEGPIYLQSWVLSGLGRVYWTLGQHERAMAIYRREVEMKRSVGDRYGEASVRYNMALVGGRLLQQGRLGAAEVDRITRDAVESAAAIGNASAEGAVRLLLAESMGWRDQIAEVQHALALLERSGDRESIRFARRLLIQARFFAESDSHDDLLADLDALIVDAREYGDRFAEARGMILRASLLMAGEYPRARVVQAYVDALDAIERIRDLQPEGAIRARSFGEWAFVYHRFAGYVLREPSANLDDDLEQAFHTVERMRARVLLDSMDGAGITSWLASGPEHAERDAVLGRIAALQKELVDPRLDPQRRSRLLGELERLEADETVRRDRMAREDPAFARRHTPGFPTLSRVREMLGPREAMLAFHLHEHIEDNGALRFRYGGSWVMAITRNGTRAIPLPDRPVVAERVSLFLGLFGARDGFERSAALRLYDDLLAEAIDDLPEAVDRLIVVPDAELYDLPFGSLRASPAGHPLAAAFEISYAPSATLWAHWRENPAETLTGVALGLADPALEVADPTANARDADPWLEGLRLGPLPAAGREARAMVRRLGSGGDLLAGSEATEHALKTADLSRFGVLHVAAHAVVDRERPERSAIVLVPGEAAEDGLLQPREIVGLDLQDQLVILSACRSASGEFVAGEGILGLSRAFFEAGARTVVASVWPLRDDEAARLIDSFSSELARGRSVAAALAAAKRESIAGGTPGAAWAGMVVLGDGDLVPFPAGSDRGLHPLVWVGGILLVITVAILVRRSR